MNRDKMLQTLDKEEWDILIIGGGATGLGTAVDSASRGYKTLLIEQHDFAKATSSRSTKLIHGGLRYLQQGNIALVLEALRERGRLCQNAPHLIYHRAFFVPSYKWWEGPFYGVGLKIYDMLAGKLGLEASKYLSREETLAVLPNLEPEGLRNGILYYDGQFDDSRLALTLAQTAIDHGAIVINYMKMTNVIKQNSQLIGIHVIDQETNNKHEIRAKVIINATGIFSDQIRRIDTPNVPNIIQPSQGVHIVLEKDFLDSETAILIPHTEDGRVLFMVPWHDRILLGTTDTLVTSPELEPKPREEEIDFILKNAGKYLLKRPVRNDILSIFAGLRPLIAHPGKKTSALSRHHSILVSHSGLLTIAGGKWTTYRKMAEDVIDKAILVGHLEEHPCRTKNLKLHGWLDNADPIDPWSTYGSNREDLQKLLQEDPSYKNLLNNRLPYVKGEVIWSVRKEMARTVEDVLARRTRSLFIDAAIAAAVAPEVAHLIAKERKMSKVWEEEQVKSFKELAKSYLV